MNGKQAKMLRRINATSKEKDIYTSFPHKLKGAIRENAGNTNGLLAALRDMQK